MRITILTFIPHEESNEIDVVVGQVEEALKKNGHEVPHEMGAPGLGPIMLECKVG